MLASTLTRLHAALPGVRLRQTYGLTEMGVLHSRSKAPDSLWLQVGGDGFETKVVEGTLFVRGASTMLGYLNAPSPLTEDGWINTGDKVEVDGEWLRILGRESEIINVGGLKVFPAAIENVMQMMENVDDVVVSAQPNGVTGQIVVAQVQLRSAESATSFRTQMRAFCKARGMADYMIPQKVVLAAGPLYGSRFKKVRT
jgi:acyl-CoA synthetase (AMP-forming)/AMP-acid ligase II